MSSVVEICNQALARVGQTPIVNIDDGDRLSRLCKLLYVPKRDALLRSYRWKFSIKRKELPALATAPVYGYTNAYQVPNDSLRILAVNDLDPEFDPDLDPKIWDIEADTIVTDEVAPIKVRYISRVEDPSLFDANFSDAFSIYLAYFLIPSLREVDPATATDLFNEFNFTVNQARHVNAIEAKPRRRKLTRSSWVNGGNRFYNGY